MAGGLGRRFMQGREGAVDLDELDASLHRCLDEARRAWPGIILDEARFIAYLAERAPPEVPAIAGLALLHTDDLYIACACADGVSGAVEAFERKRLDAVPSYLAHVGASPTLSDEVVQQLRAKLFVATPPALPKIVSYSGRGSLSKWVGVTAQRIAIAALRGAGTRQRREALADLLPLDVSPELEYLRTRYRRAFREAFAEGIRCLDDRQRVLLRLSLIKGLSQERIAQMYSVNQSTIARWLATARDAITAAMQEFLRERLRIESSEFDSLAAMIRSDLDLSLARLLDEEP